MKRWIFGTENMTELEFSLINDIRSLSNRSELLKSLRRCSDWLKQTAPTSSWAPFQFFRVGEALLSICNPSILGYLTQSEYDKLYMNVFCTLAPPIDSFLLLHKILSDLDRNDSTTLNNKSFVAEKIMQISARFVKTRRFDALLSNLVDKGYSDAFDDVFDQLASALVSFPSKLANLTRGQVLECFTLSVYTKHVTLAYLRSFEVCLAKLESNAESTLKFHCHLMTKLYMQGYCSHMIPILVPFLRQRCKNGQPACFLWRKISRRFFTGLSGAAFDGFLTKIITFCQSGSKFEENSEILDLSHFLGDSILTDNKIRLCLTRKLIFTRYFDSYVVPATVLVYLARCQTDQALLSALFLDLLAMWSSEAAVINDPVEKHWYHSQCIAMCIKLLNVDQINGLKSKMTDHLLKGIQNHLNANRNEIRLFGMVIGEILTDSLENDPDDQKLKFDYVDNDKTILLKRLAKNIDFKFDSDSDQADRLDQLFDLEPDSSVDDPLNSENSTKHYKNIVFDSDDDLEPYEIPIDADRDHFADSGDKKSIINKPRYLRDCIDILCDAKSNYDSYSIALTSIEKLVLGDSPEFSVVVLDLMRLLLHMEDKYAMENFERIRLDSMIAICVKSPESTCLYLIEQFYAPGFCLQRRLDILEVLRLSAEKLSKLGSTTEPQQSGVTVEKSLYDKNTVDETNINFRRIIDERLKSKTRYFGRTTDSVNRGACTASVNKFSPYVSHFFYPLLYKFDRPSDATMDLLMRDHFVLSRLLYTVGSIIQYAENCPTLPTVSVKMFEFAWNLRKHGETLVRQGVLFCFLSILLANNPKILMDHLYEFLNDLRDFLAQMAQRELDSETRQLAASVLTLLMHKAHEGSNFVQELTTQS